MYNHLEPVPAEFSLTIEYERCYRDWNPHSKDAWNDAQALTKAIIEAGIRPTHILYLGMFCVLYFNTWQNMSEANDAIGHVLDLLWLLS